MWREDEPNGDWSSNHFGSKVVEEGHPGCAGLYEGRLFASRCSLEMPCFCESGAATAESEYLRLANEVRAKFFVGVAAKEGGSYHDDRAGGYKLARGTHAQCALEICPNAGPISLTPDQRSHCCLFGPGAGRAVGAGGKVGSEDTALL